MSIPLGLRKLSFLSFEEPSTVIALHVYRHAFGSMLGAMLRCRHNFKVL